MIRVIIAEVQNGELKVVMNIVHDTLIFKHFLFSEQIVLLNGFSTSSPKMYGVGFLFVVGLFFFFPSSLSQR